MEKILNKVGRKALLKWLLPNMEIQENKTTSSNNLIQQPCQTTLSNNLVKHPHQTTLSPTLRNNLSKRPCQVSICSNHINCAFETTWRANIVPILHWRSCSMCLHLILACRSCCNLPNNIVNIHFATAFIGYVFL